MLENKKILITGCSRGIGREILEELAKNRASIWAHARSESSEFSSYINLLKERYKVEILPLYFDVCDTEAIKKAFLEIKKGGGLDVLINNAGITQNSLFLMSKYEDLKQVFEINFFSVFNITQYAAKLMMKQAKGIIVNISSISSFGGDIGRSAYGASKAAINSLTKTLSSELGQYNIRVNAIAPGFIDTSMLNVLSDEDLKKNIERINLRRLGTVSDVAKLVVFLSSEHSSYMNGQILRLDGGM